MLLFKQIWYVELNVVYLKQNCQSFSFRPTKNLARFSTSDQLYTMKFCPLISDKDL